MEVFICIVSIAIGCPFGYVAFKGQRGNEPMVILFPIGLTCVIWFVLTLGWALTCVAFGWNII